MLSTRSQQQKHDELQSQLDLLGEKIKRLRKDHVIETEADSRFKLEMKIEEAEAERAALERRLDELGQAPIRPPSGPIPLLLPYLSDRGDQEEALRRALELLIPKKSRRPFLCIIHGDEYECHDKYLERLQHISLPQIFKLDTERVAIKDISLTWPSGRQQNFSEALRANLGAALVGESMASTQTLSAALSRVAVPALIHTHLLTEDLAHAGAETIAAWIQFWQAWPDLAHGQQLVVALFLKYQRPERLGYWQKRKRQQQNQALREGIAGVNFSAWENVYGLALPELSPIKRGEVEEWMREHARPFYDTAALEPQIRELYKTGGGIPMELLVAALKKLLNEHRL